MTKADLKNGDVVLKRNGNVLIVCADTETMITKDSFNMLSHIMDDLTHFEDRSCDIVAVRRPRFPSECQFKAFDFNLGKLVYDRKRDEVIDMTLEQVCEELGKTIRIVKEHE